MTVKTAPKTAEAPVEAPRTIDLELVVYSRYNLGGIVYEKEKAYRFSEPQALQLLEEVEDTTGKPVWRRYRPKPVAQRPDSGVKTVIDASKNDVAPRHDPDADVVSRGRIDV